MSTDIIGHWASQSMAYQIRIRATWVTSVERLFGGLAITLEDNGTRC